MGRSMRIYEESLNRFIKNSWIYYEANDPYYAGKIEQISIERVHDKILYYEVKATIQTRWSEEILNFRVNEYGTLLTTNCTCCQDPHSGCVHLVSVVRAINAINPQTFPFHVDYQNYVKEDLKKRKSVAAENHLVTGLVDAVCKNSYADFPESLIKSEVEHQVNNVEMQAKQYGMPVETLLQYSGVASMDEFKKSAEEHIRKSFLEELVLEKIMELENIEASQEEIEKEY